MVGTTRHHRRVARVVLLVPSSTYRAADFLEAARRQGVEVVVASEEAHLLSELVGGGRGLAVDLDDPDRAAAAIVAHDATWPIDAVVAVDDQGTVVAAEAARRLGLRHNPPEAVAAARDKLLMRRRLEAAEVPQPAYTALAAGTGDADAVALAEAIGFPLVVKPTSLSGSQGVLRVDDPASLPAVVARVRRIADEAGVPAEAPLLLERFVPGPEVAVEGLLHHGELAVLAVFDKPDPLEGPAFEETIYVTPSRLPAADQQAAVSAVAGATDALGLIQGPVHGEVRVADGRAALIEVAARTIGGLCARALSFDDGALGEGRSLEDLVLAQALGTDLGTHSGTTTTPPTPKTASGVLMIPIPRAGTLLSVEGRAQAGALAGITGVEITVAPGRPLAPPPEGNRYLGFVFATGPDPATVEFALRAAQEVLEVRVG
jgi:phosphoribosylaminoimidazole carboxylase (NCAIR synthetase)